MHRPHPPGSVVRGLGAGRGGGALGSGCSWLALGIVYKIKYKGVVGGWRLMAASGIYLVWSGSGTGCGAVERRQRCGAIVWSDCVEWQQQVVEVGLVSCKL